MSSVNYYDNTIDFNKVVYAVNYTEEDIEQVTYGELVTRYASKTTSKVGVAAEMHVENDVELRAYDQWGGNKLIHTFATNKEAIQAMLLCHQWDFLNGDSSVEAFDTYKDAKAAYQEYLGGLA